jgi:hypothetical protein
MGTRAGALAVGAAACAAVVIAGCGGSGSKPSPPSTRASTATTEPSATALITAMQTSVRQASSIHVTGRLTNSGVPITVNLDMHRNGDVSGTESLNGAPYQIIGVHGTVYVKATRSFLQEVKAPASACATACGRWLQLTPVLANQLTGDFSMSNFTGPLTSSRLPKFTEAGTKMVGGQTAWVLSAGQGVTLEISSAGGHFPLAATTGGSTSEVITYSQWNSAPEPVAPPANDVLNLSNLR